MGRPVIYIRVTPEQHELIARAAEAEGHGLTNWARQELRRKAGVPHVRERKFSEGRYGDKGGQSVIYIRADEELHKAVNATAEGRGLKASHWALDVLIAAARRKLDINT